MSVVFVVVLPAVSAGWPMIATVIGAACAAMGYTAQRVQERAAAQVAAEDSMARQVELEMANAEVIGEALAREQTLRVEKDGVTATFRKDARGKLSLHVDGERTREELTAIGNELLNRVRQQYAAEKVKGELLKQGFVLVEEHVDEEESIRLSVRRFR
jgi:hypothetical protein